MCAHCIKSWGKQCFYTRSLNHQFKFIVIFERTEFYRRKMKRNLHDVHTNTGTGTSKSTSMKQPLIHIYINTIVRSTWYLPWLNRISYEKHQKKKRLETIVWLDSRSSSSFGFVGCCCSFFPLLKCMLMAIVRAFGSHTHIHSFIHCIFYLFFKINARDKNQIFYYYFYKFSFVLTCLGLLSW